MSVGVLKGTGKERPSGRAGSSEIVRFKYFLQTPQAYRTINFCLNITSFFDATIR